MLKVLYYHFGVDKDACGAALFLPFFRWQARFSDAQGNTLSGMAAARAHAITQVRDLKAAMCDPGIQDLSGWSMTVADADDNIVFETSFDVKLQGAKD